jgi:thioesterase domain-containing protein
MVTNFQPLNINRSLVEQYVHEHIPLSKNMGVSVVSIDDNGVILSAPLLPNINHRSTAFGGSISAVMILAAWILVHTWLEHLSFPCRIVIQSNCVEYLKPIETDFQVKCAPPPPQEGERFVKAVSKKGKGRIILNCQVDSNGLVAATFQGEYVALKR